MSASPPDAPDGPDGGRQPEAHYVLRLFVAGTTSRSARAVGNLQKLCERYLGGRYELDVVDIYRNPDAAKTHQVVAAPTLVRMQPAPMRRIIGDLSDTLRVLHGLGIVPATGDQDQDMSEG